MPEVERELVAAAERGDPVVLATVIRLDGEPPSHTGAKALVGSGALLAGTLGCSEFDGQAIADAPGLLAAGQPGLATYTHELGSIEVYLEPHVAAPALIVLGDTPVGRALKRWAPEVGFALLEAPVPGREIFAVATDHDAPGLVEELEPILRNGARYVGVMGSRRHTGHHLEELRRRGLDPSGIQSPVGLDIGAQTAEEIALAILAGLVAVRRGAAGSFKDQSSR